MRFEDQGAAERQRPFLFSATPANAAGKAEVQQLRLPAKRCALILASRDVCGNER